VCAVPEIDRTDRADGVRLSRYWDYAHASSETGAGYAGPHVTLRLTAKLRKSRGVELTLVDRHDYHQVVTELPRVAGGSRPSDFAIPGLAESIATPAALASDQRSTTAMSARNRTAPSGAQWRTAS
jgi:hypothetical protein